MLVIIFLLFFSHAGAPPLPPDLLLPAVLSPQGGRPRHRGPGVLPPPREVNIKNIKKNKNILKYIFLILKKKSIKIP